MLKTERILQLIEQFNQAIHVIEDIECWSARELAVLFGYKWDNFLNVIEKAKNACLNSGGEVNDHFPEVGKMVQIGSRAEREIVDYALSRYACYLIAQNGDPRKEEIAFAQTYFAVQTRNSELIHQRLSDAERVSARNKLTESENKLSGIIYEHGVEDSQGFARIKSKGDTKLFGGFTTKEMKRKYNVPENRPLADFLPTVTIKAKDFANEITTHNIITHNLQGEDSITSEHEKSNTSVREALTKSGIKPENLPPAPDVKKVKKRLDSEEKKLLNPPKNSKDKSEDESKV